MFLPFNSPSRFSYLNSIDCSELLGKINFHIRNTPLRQNPLLSLPRGIYPLPESYQNSYIVHVRGLLISFVSRTLQINSLSVYCMCLSRVQKCRSLKFLRKKQKKKLFVLSLTSFRLAYHYKSGLVIDSLLSTLCNCYNVSYKSFIA